MNSQNSFKQILKQRIRENEILDTDDADCILKTTI